MFESRRLTAQQREAQHQLGLQMERRDPTETPESAVLLERLGAAVRQENRAAATRVSLAGELFAYRLRRGGETEDWAVDTMDCVAAEIAAVLTISHAFALSHVRYGRAMRERLPAVGAVFTAGDIDYGLFQTAVFRTDLITDPDVLARVDAQVAAAVPRWTSMTRRRAAAHIDRIVARLDPDAVRRRTDAAQGREVWISDRLDGLTEIGATVFTTAAHALDKRLDALAATVCGQDPRTKAQRRADAIEALAAGADRMSCRCGVENCAAGGLVAAPVVIHVIAGETADSEGSLMRADGLLPCEVVEQLAEHAKRRPLIHPGDAPPEPGHNPSRALADFVRCRDLTCRFPGCDRSAMGCDIDHSIPYGDGGPTQASNLKCLCRRHHLLKTFAGWHDQQLSDGTLIWTSPSGDTRVTTPGSALLFPGLCTPTPTKPPAPQRNDRCGERTAKMPKRRRTRAQNHAARIAAERRANHIARNTRRAAHPEARISGFAPAPYEDPPPF